MLELVAMQASELPRTVGGRQRAIHIVTQRFWSLCSDLCGEVSRHSCRGRVLSKIELELELSNIEGDQRSHFLHPITESTNKRLPFYRAYRDGIEASHGLFDIVQPFISRAPNIFLGDLLPS